MKIKQIDTYTKITLFGIENKIEGGRGCKSIKFKRVGGNLCKKNPFTW